MIKFYTLESHSTISQNHSYLRLYSINFNKTKTILCRKIKTFQQAFLVCHPTFFASVTTFGSFNQSSNPNINLPTPKSKLRNLFHSTAVKSPFNVVFEVKFQLSRNFIGPLHQDLRLLEDEQKISI